MIPNYTLNLLTLQVVSISSTPTFVLVKNYVYLKIDIIWWNVIFCSENDEVQAWLMFRILCRKPLALLLVPYRAYLPTCTLYLDPHCSAHLGGKTKQNKTILCFLLTERSISLFSNHTNPTHRHQDKLNSCLWWMLWHHTSSTLEDWDTHSASCSEVWQLTALRWVPLAQGHITAQRKLTLKDWLMVETAKAWLLCSNPRQLWKAIPAPGS